MKTNLNRVVLLVSMLGLGLDRVHATDGPGGPDQDICSVNTALTADPLQTGQVGFWSLISGSGTFSNATSPFTTLNGLSIGTNIVTWTLVGGGGTMVDEVVIQVYDLNLPAAQAGPDTALCMQQPTMQLLATPVLAPVLGTWNVVTGSADVLSPTNPHSTVALTSAQATLAWVVFNGPCGQTEDDVVLTLDMDCTVGIANARTSDMRVIQDPSTGRLRIENIQGEVSVALYDALGRGLLTTVRQATGTVFLPWTAPQPGLYLASVTTTAGTQVARFFAP